MSKQTSSSVTTTFTVTGMTCGNCERHVREAAQKVPGVASVSVDLSGGRATVAYDGVTTTSGAIASAITEAGYEAVEAPGAP